MKKIASIALLFVASFMATVASAQENKTFIHLKSGDVLEYLCNEIDSITFESESEYDLDIKATYSRNFYLGNRQYFIHLSDKPLDENGLPTQVGQIMTRFLAIAPAPAEGESVFSLPAGTYTSSDSGQDFTIYLTGWDFFLDCIMGCQGFDGDGNPTGFIRDYSQCEANIEQNGDKTYLHFTGELIKEAENEPYGSVRCVYNGKKLTFINEDASQYTKLETDATLVPTLSAGVYYGYGAYNITLANTPLDEEGYISGAGEHLNIELLANPTEAMDVNQLPGTYKVCAIDGTNFTPGSFMSGVYTRSEDYGYYLPMGTYYTVYDEKGYSTKTYGFATDGTIKLTIEDANLHLVGDIVTESSAHVKFNCLMPLEYFTDMTQTDTSMAPASKAAASGDNVTLPSCRKPKKLIPTQPTIRLVKIK